MAIRKGARTLPKGTEPHAKRYIPPTSGKTRHIIPSVSHHAAFPRKQGPKGKDADYGDGK